MVTSAAPRHVVRGQRETASTRSRRRAACWGRQEAIELDDRFGLAGAPQLRGLFDARGQTFRPVSRLARHLQQPLTQRHRLLDTPAPLLLTFYFHAGLHPVSLMRIDNSRSGDAARINIGESAVTNVVRTADQQRPAAPGASTVAAAPARSRII
ncbi:hypothetical protein [Bradyrhizobium sp. SZCCHNR1015]|uniref:hypothetical protein n=1 Tax=Bradyrhizobium sp. SZCCHNR1015 TaxID=3057338 RepID=UPI003966BAD8